MRHRTAALVAATIVLAAGLQGSPVAAPAASAAGPSLSAPSSILVEPQTGDVVSSRRATQRRPIASTTKLMTALLLLERRRLADRITAVPYSGLAAESIAGFRGGERVTAADMLRALLLASANDAAASIAVNVGGSQSRFVRMMNQRARRAGLRDTHYANPIGLDDARNYSTATDLAKLALLVRRNAFARRVMDRPSTVLRSGDRPRFLENRNTLVAAVPWINGVKTGHTQSAGYILVGSASRGGVALISAVLGTPSEDARNADTLALMNYGFARYHRLTPVVAGRTVARLTVKDQDGRVRVVPARSARVVARRGERLRTVLRGLPDQVEGPLADGARVGQVQVLRRGRVVARVPLVTASAVARAGLWQRHAWLGPLLGALTLVGVGGLLVASLQSRSRRQQRRSRARSETA